MNLMTLWMYTDTMNPRVQARRLLSQCQINDATYTARTERQREMLYSDAV